MQLLAPSLQTKECDSSERERLEQQGGAHASDYSTVFLPWGAEWTAEKVRNYMWTKDMVLNSKWYDPNKKVHTHPCFMGTMRYKASLYYSDAESSQVIRDCCGHCPKVPEEEIDPDTPYVRIYIGFSKKIGVWSCYLGYCKSWFSEHKNWFFSPYH